MKFLDAKNLKFNRITLFIIVTCLIFNFFELSIESNAASAKVSVYVVDRITWVEQEEALDYLTDEENAARKVNYKYKYNYYGSGLIKSTVYSFEGKYDYTRIHKYVYTGKRIDGTIYDNDINEKSRYLRDKKGRITMYQETRDNGVHWLNVYKYKCDSKGRIISATSVIDSRGTTKYKYDGKNRVVKLTSKVNYGKKAKSITKISYDSEGYTNKIGNSEYINTYNEEGLLVERKKLYSTPDGSENRERIYKIKYKKIKVSKSDLKIIRKQQNWLIESGSDGFAMLLSSVQ